MNRSQLDRAFRAFIRCHEAVNNATSVDRLLSDVCGIAVNELGYRLAWIGLVSPDRAEVRAAAHAGHSEGFADTVVVSASEHDPRGRGPCGSAIRERRPAVCRNIAEDEHFAPWREEALQRGYGSSVALPLCDSSRCFGVMSIYASEPDAFTGEEIALLEDMASDIALGMRALESSRILRDLRELEIRVRTASSVEVAGNVIASVAHDIANHLTAIQLSVQSARTSTSPEGLAAALTGASHSADSAIQMLRQLTALARRASSDAKPAEIDTVLQRLRWLLARLCETGTVHIDPAAGDAVVPVSAIDLERVIINLVINAAGALADDGRIDVSTVRRFVHTGLIRGTRGELPSGDFAVLQVADNGSGIPSDALPHLFEPFFSTKGNDGTGLGLFSVAQIATTAGGDVTVESTPNKGTRITVYLPIVRKS